MVPEIVKNDYFDISWHQGPNLLVLGQFLWHIDERAVQELYFGHIFAPS